MPELIERAADATCSLITNGLERTQSTFNTGPAKE